MHVKSILQQDQHFITYSDSPCCSLSTGQCTGGGHHGNGVGSPCNQSSDGGSSGNSPSTH